MASTLTLILNGQQREFPDLAPPATLTQVIAVLALKPDRIAVELNGQIAPRATWHELETASGDRLEIVHFVGGGINS